MSLMEIVMAVMLFALTAGSVVDMWAASTHAAKEVALQRYVDDVAEQYAEEVSSGMLQVSGGEQWTFTDEQGLVFTIKLKGSVTDGAEIAVSSGAVHQSLQVFVPR